MMNPVEAVCISLAKRHGRWQRFWEGLNAVVDWPFPSVRWFPAIDGTITPHPEAWNKYPGAWGAMLSHRQVLQEALEARIDSILVFEDDAIPTSNDLGERWRAIQPELQEHPCDMLWLGGQLVSGRRHVSPSLARPNLIWRSHAYIITPPAIEVLLNDLKTPRDHVDHRMGAMVFSRRINALAVQPWLFTVRGEKSDVLPERKHAKKV